MGTKCIYQFILPLRLNPISYFTPTHNFRVPHCPSEQSYKA